MNKVYEIVTDRIIKAMENGVIPWQKPWVGGVAQNLARKYDYRGINVFNLGMAPYSMPYWVSQKDLIKFSGATIEDGTDKRDYKKIVTEMPCRLLSGELYNSSIVIYTNWLNKTDDDDKIVGKIPFTKYYRVWNVEQTTIPGERPDLIPEEFNNPVDPIEAADNIVKQFADCPAINHKEARAYYVPSLDKVNMPKKTTFKSSEGYYATLFHELGHSTGHATRMGREFGGGFGSDKYAREELVAEFASAFLCGKAGIDNTVDQAASYLEGWLKAIKSDKNMLVWAASRGQKAADYIQGRKYEQAHEETEQVAVAA